MITRSFLKAVLIGCLFFLVAVANKIEAAECLALNTNVFTPVVWSAPIMREDNKPLSINEIAGYRFYKKETQSGFSCWHTITPGSKTQANIEVRPNVEYEIKAKTFDIDDRFSTGFSNVVLRTEALDLLLPAAVSDLSITKVSANSYEFNFSPVVNYANGSSLPVGALRKYFLFKNGKWLKNVLPERVPFILTLPNGVFRFDLETEISTPGGLIVSERSDVFVLDTASSGVILPPRAPVLLQ